MTEPADGLPIDLPRSVRDLLEQDDPRRLPLLTLRRPSCGCRVGAVRRMPSGDLVRMICRVQVAGVRNRLLHTVVDLADPHRPVDWSCQHGSGSVDLQTLQEAARSARTRGGIFLVE